MAWICIWSVILTIQNPLTIKFNVMDFRVSFLDWVIILCKIKGQVTSEWISGVKNFPKKTTKKHNKFLTYNLTSGQIKKRIGMNWDGHIYSMTVYNVK